MLVPLPKAATAVYFVPSEGVLAEPLPSIKRPILHVPFPEVQDSWAEVQVKVPTLPLLEATVGSCAFTAAVAKSVNQRTERIFFIGLRKGTQLDTNPSPLVAYTLDI